MQRKPRQQRGWFQHRGICGCHAHHPTIPRIQHLSVSALPPVSIFSLYAMVSKPPRQKVCVVDFLCSNASSIVRESSHRRPALFAMISESAADPISCSFLSKVTWYKAHKRIQKETPVANFLRRGTHRVYKVLGGYVSETASVTGLMVSHSKIRTLES